MQTLFSYQNYAAYDSNVRHLHKRSPGVLISFKLAKLSALKGFSLVKAAGVGGAVGVGKTKKASKSAQALTAAKAIKGGKNFAFLVGR